MLRPCDISISIRQLCLVLFRGRASHVLRGSFLFPSYSGSAHVSCQWGRAGSRWLPTEEGVLESSERATDGKAYMPPSPLSLPTVP